MRTAVVIANPYAGRARRQFEFAELVARLHAQGINASLEETTHAGHATELARRAVSGGMELIVACGGDGTLREVAEGMLGFNAVLLPLATGTTNVIAAGLGLGGNPLAVIDRLHRLRECNLKIGLCGDRPFLMQASTGIDAVVMAEVRQDLKQRFGMLAVALTGFRCWLRYGFPEIRVSVDDIEYGCRGAIVFSFPFYAGPYRLAPQVRADDDQLNVLLFTGRGRWAAAGFAIDVARGRHSRRRDVQIMKARRVQFLSPANLPLQIDGDAHWVSWPVENSLSSPRLRILCAPDAPALRG